MKKVVKNEPKEWAELRASLFNFLDTVKKSKDFKKSNHIKSVQGDTVLSCVSRNNKKKENEE